MPGGADQEQDSSSFTSHTVENKAESRRASDAPQTPIVLGEAMHLCHAELRCIAPKRRGLPDDVGRHCGTSPTLDLTIDGN